MPLWSTLVHSWCYFSAPLVLPWFIFGATLELRLYYFVARRSFLAATFGATLEQRCALSHSHHSFVRQLCCHLSAFCVPFVTTFGANPVHIGITFHFGAVWVHLWCPFGPALVLLCALLGSLGAPFVLLWCYFGAPLVYFGAFLVLL